MTAPEVNSENFKKTGTEVVDYLARSHKVSTKELEDALSDKAPVAANKAAQEAAEKQKKAAEAASLAKK